MGKPLATFSVPFPAPITASSTGWALSGGVLKDRGINASPRGGRSASAGGPGRAAWEAKPSGHSQEHRLVSRCFFPLEEISTLEQVVVERLVGGEHGRHLVMVGRVDVLVNAVARELHLPQEGGRSQTPSRAAGAGQGDTACIPGVHPPGTGLPSRRRIAHTLSKHRDTGLFRNISHTLRAGPAGLS